MSITAGSRAGRRRPEAAVRALGGLVASCAAIAGLTLTTAGPAHAGDHMELHITPDNVQLPAGSAGRQGQPETVTAFVIGGDDSQPTQVRAELSGLAGAATATWPAGCTPDSGGESALCDFPRSGMIKVTLRADVGAPHAQGTVTFTGVSANLAGDTVKAAVSVQSGPDLYFDGVPARTKAQPGHEVTLPFRVVNAGDQAADGAMVYLDVSPGLEIADRSSSCLYGPHTEWVLCFLDGVPSGTTVSYAHALTFTPKPASLIEDVEMRVGLDTPQARDQFLRDHSGGVRGTGPALKPDGSTAGVPASYLSSGVHPKIDVDNTAEMSITTPSPLRAARGATLHVDLSVTNHGPADYIDSWDEYPAAYVEFVPPPGTRITSFVDVGCDILSKDDSTALGLGEVPAGDHVVCKTSYYFGAGGTVQVPFTLHVDKVIPGATGKAFFRTSSPDGRPMFWDKNTANNTATLVLNPAKSGGTAGGTSAGASAGASGGSTAGGSGTAGTSGSMPGGSTAGGSGTAGASGSMSGSSSGGTSGTSPDGSLAATGSGPAPLITAVAGTACAAGAAALLLARSRRRRRAGAARP